MRHEQVHGGHSLPADYEALLGAVAPSSEANTPDAPLINLSGRHHQLGSSWFKCSAQLTSF